jgi:hypothetical protein
LCAAPRSLSQLTTSFIASQSQGIHHTPLIALKKLKINMTTDCDISIIDKNNTRYYNFSQYVKERNQAQSLRLKAKSKMLNVDDVKMMNLLTYRNPIVKHQYEKN